MLYLKLLSQEKDRNNRKKPGSRSQSTSPVLHHDEDPGRFVHNQIFGSSRYSEELFT